MGRTTVKAFVAHSEYSNSEMISSTYTVYPRPPRLVKKKGGRVRGIALVHGLLESASVYVYVSVYVSVYLFVYICVPSVCVLVRAGVCCFVFGVC
jgi:hypothetical protein